LCALVGTNKGLDVVNARNNHEDDPPALDPEVIHKSILCVISTLAKGY